MKQKPKTKDTPVFLFFGAQGADKKKLDNIEEELLSIRSSIVQEFKSEVECHIFPRTSFKIFKKTIRTYRDRCVFIHFAGHGGNGNIETDDFSVHAKDLVDLILPEYAPKLKLVFLNACSTSILVPKLLDAEIERVIATEADIDDRLATEFAKDFYDELCSPDREKTILDAFTSAKVGISEEKKGQLELRGVGFREKKGQSYWGLYKNTSDSFYIKDILQKPVEISNTQENEPIEISNTQENKPIRIDNLICQLNRSRLDITLAKIRENFPQNKSNTNLNKVFSTVPLILYDKYIHAPHLYVKKISYHFGFKKIRYTFPENKSPNLSQELAISINLDLIKENIKADPSKGVSMLLSKYKESDLLLFTEIKKTKKPMQLLKQHHEFWNKIKVPGKNILSLILIHKEHKENSTFLSNYFLSLTEKKLEKWNKQQTFFFPNMENISISERKEWEDSYPEIKMIFQDKKYDKKISKFSGSIPLKIIYDLVKKVHYSR